MHVNDASAMTTDRAWVIGIIRPHLKDATLERQDIAPTPTVGAASFAAATDTPHLCGHTK